MRVDLLRKQVQVLRDDAANPNGVQFNLKRWCEPADAKQLDPKLLLDDDPAVWNMDATGNIPVSCGTSACAFGLSALLGTFKDEGLSYTIDCRGSMVPRLQRPGRYYEGFNAAIELFEITRDDAEYLFDLNYYSGGVERAGGELRVADRIERFIDGDIDRKFHPKHAYGF